jgi:predicted DCC family thiol-disulfide oxidoreductase YuxK
MTTEPADRDPRIVHVPNPPYGRPLLVYDGHCDFCRFWLARWRRRIGDRIAYEPYQKVADRFPVVPRERFRRAVQLIEPDGRVYGGAEAVFRALAQAPRGGRWLHFYRRVPGARPCIDAGYRFVARHRPGLYRLTRLVFRQKEDRSGATTSSVRPAVWVGLGLGAAALVTLVGLRKRQRG